MRAPCFSSTDTFFTAFRDAPAAETRDLDDNTLLEVDAQGSICAITTEHAPERAHTPKVS
jgi:uncharacterized protein YuzE